MCKINFPLNLSTSGFSHIPNPISPVIRAIQALAKGIFYKASCLWYGTLNLSNRLLNILNFWYLKAPSQATTEEEYKRLLEAYLSEPRVFKTYISEEDFVKEANGTLFEQQLIEQITQDIVRKWCLSIQDKRKGYNQMEQSRVITQKGCESIGEDIIKREALTEEICKETGVNNSLLIPGDLERGNKENHLKIGLNDILNFFEIKKFASLLQQGIHASGFEKAVLLFNSNDMYVVDMNRKNLGVLATQNDSLGDWEGEVAEDENSIIDDFIAKHAYTKLIVNETGQVTLETAHVYKIIEQKSNDSVLAYLKVETKYEKGEFSITIKRFDRSI